MYQLEQACKIQLTAQSSGAKLNFPDASIAAKTRRQGDASMDNAMAARNAMQWAAMRRWMEELDPSFMN